MVLIGCTTTFCCLIVCIKEAEQDVAIAKEGEQYAAVAKKQGDVAAVVMEKTLAIAKVDELQAIVRSAIILHSCCEGSFTLPSSRRSLRKINPKSKLLPRKIGQNRCES